jgi:AraC family transcriptional regulator
MSGALGAIHDVAERLGQRSTAIANLCVISAGGAAPEHRHSNPYLWLHVLGAYREAGDGGEHLIDGPAAMFFPAGSAHAMAVSRQGLASIILEFDADWLRRRMGPGVDLARTRLWAGREAGRRASRLARVWLSEDAPHADRFDAAERFLNWTMELPPTPPAPAWLAEVGERIGLAEDELQPRALARAMGVPVAWLARAYRRWRGEGLAVALRRHRVAAAAALIEGTNQPLAEIAAATGFCDQSHMNRGFRLLFGRTPASLRSAPLGFGTGAIGVRVGAAGTLVSAAPSRATGCSPPSTSIADLRGSGAL